MVAGIAQQAIKAAIETEQIDVSTSAKVVSLPRCLYVGIYNTSDQYNAYIATTNDKFTIPPKTALRLDYVHGDLKVWADASITLEVVRCRIL